MVQQLRTAFDDLAKKLQFTSWQDWYKISFSKLDRSSFPTEIKKFGIKELKEAYPEIQWEDWKFTRTPPHFWKDVENRRAFFNSLQQKLNLRSKEDWYNINGVQEIKYHGGRSLIFQYKDSFPTAIMDTFPEYNWKPWKFPQVPAGYWDDVSNQRKFLEDFGELNKINTFEQWYEVKSEDIRNHGGAVLLKLYKDCYMTAITSILKEYPWEMWKFKKTPQGFWLNLENQRKFLTSLETRLRMQSWEDWYQVSQQTFIEHDGKPLLRIHGSLYPMLVAAFPERKWEMEKFKSISWKVKNSSSVPSTFKSQAMLFNNILQAIPGRDIHINYQLDVSAK